jgi:NADPH-dependent glutamate synthase beta subunit-like oxidoreductase
VSRHTRGWRQQARQHRGARWAQPPRRRVAGGDIVTGAATVILAMGAGKKAAAKIHEYVQNKKAAR